MVKRWRVLKMELGSDPMILSLDEDRAYATGTRTLVKIDQAVQRPTPWSSDFRERVALYCRTSGPT